MEVLDRVDADRIAALRARDEFFWLDLRDPSPADLDALAELLHLPPMAVQDSREFGQRPKLDAYGDRVLIVFYGVDHGIEEPGLIEVHVHASGSEVVTLRRAGCMHLDAARDQIQTVGPEEEVIVRVLSALARSLGELVEAIAAEVERLEEESFEHPTQMDRTRISVLRGRLFRLAQVVGPERDMLAADAELLESLPGLEHEQARHPFRDVHDELVLTMNAIAFARERLGEALNVYLASVSNRLNELAARLTLFASVFLPLTFITGFFGQNFGWLVDHIDSLAAFLLLGVGGSLVPAVVTVLLLWRSGYLRVPRQ
jgi:magnesium transporter